MKMIGALSKSAQKASNIYFFSCTKRELDLKSIRQLIIDTSYDKRVDINSIQIVAIESDDELVCDRRLVGFIFKCDEETYQSITLSEHPDLDEYLRFMIEV